jgi:hypothetical protein
VLRHSFICGPNFTANRDNLLRSDQVLHCLPLALLQTPSPSTLTPGAFPQTPQPRLPNEPSESSAPATEYACFTRKLTRPYAAISPLKSPLPDAPSLAFWRALKQASRRLPLSRRHFQRLAVPRLADGCSSMTPLGIK